MRTGESTEQLEFFQYAGEWLRSLIRIYCCSGRIVKLTKNTLNGSAHNNPQLPISINLQLKVTGEGAAIILDRFEA